MNSIVLDLANSENYLKNELQGSGKSLNVIKLALPIRSEQLQEEATEANLIIFGEARILNGSTQLTGKIKFEAQNAEIEDTHFLEGFRGKIKISFDEEAVNSFEEDTTIRFSLRSDLFQNGDVESDKSELNNESEFEPAEYICSQIIPVQDDNGEFQEYEYFIFPDSTEDDIIYPKSSEREGDLKSHFTYDPKSMPTYSKSENTHKQKSFIFRIFKRNSLKREIKRFIKEYKKNPDFQGNEFIDLAIRELKKSNIVSSIIQNAYSINIYNSNATSDEKFVKIKDTNQINPQLKTLLLVPGTFKKSAVRKNGKWVGSFKYLMEPTKDFENWFEFLLKNSDFQQIISLEHDSIFDSLEDNIRYFIDHLSISNVKFEQHTAVISASRGGFLAKMLAVVGAGQDERIQSSQLNLNIEKIITVANGFSGYVDPANKELLEKKIRTLFNILSLLSFGTLGSFLWLLSFTTDFILRLPGLMGQAKDSEEIARLFSKKLDGLWCLPLANNYKMKHFKFVEKAFVDPLLGPENDFVLSFESQKEVIPGQLLPSFEPIIGEYVHGSGLSNEDIRAQILEFLNAQIPQQQVVEI